MKQILCFGDSNTYGLIPGTKNRYDWETRWTGILDCKLKDKGYRVVEEGLCGRTTVFEDPLRNGRRGTAILPTILETHHPVELVILMLGTNDCKTVYDASPQVIGKGIEILIQQIRAEIPEAKILLVSPIHLGDKVWEDGYDPEFNEISVKTSQKLPKIYKEIADRENLFYLAASKYAVPSEADREHLDHEGHQKLALALLKKVEKLVA